MQFYTKLKIILIILLAIIISYFTYSYLNSLKDETTIVVAAQDINEHTLIKREMLKEVRISKKDKDLLAKNTFSNIDELDEGITKTKILKDKPIDKTDDVITGTKEELRAKNVIDEKNEINQAYFIAEDKKVATVRVDSQGAVGNNLSIGSFVDVIFTSNNDNNNSFSKIIMNHIKVTSVQEITNKSNGDESQNISLLVSAQQAIALSFAKRNGKVDLVLDSSQGDTETTDTVGNKSFMNDQSYK